MIAVKYILFAVISTVLNLLAQYISFFIYSGLYSLYFAMFNGTLIGLIVKYALDKRFIFYDTSKGFKTHSKKFLLYSLMGIFTTLIFWGFEIVSDYLWDLKYIGAVIGLSIGYFVKYQLDKKFVFKEIDALFKK